MLGRFRPNWSGLKRKENREDLDGKDFTDKGHAGGEGNVTMSFGIYLLRAESLVVAREIWIDMSRQKSGK